MTAAEHIAAAEALIAEVDEHMAKRGRKMGLEHAGLASLANAHAALAIAKQGTTA
jgi:hypothetical protein